MKLKQFNFKKINSTNDTAIRIIMTSNNKFGIVKSELQKKGRGQHGKKWISYKGNLFLSFFYALEKINLSINKLTKFNCSLVKKAISIYYKKKITIKAPNDLLIGDKKISGILQEIINKLDKKYLIVGIGINLKTKPIIKNYPTTCLYDLLDNKPTKEEIVNSLKKIFEQNLSNFYK